MNPAGLSGPSRPCGRCARTVGFFPADPPSAAGLTACAAPVTEEPDRRGGICPRVEGLWPGAASPVQHAPEAASRPSRDDLEILVLHPATADAVPSGEYGCPEVRPAGRQ